MSFDEFCRLQPIETCAVDEAVFQALRRGVEIRGCDEGISTIEDVPAFAPRLWHAQHATENLLNSGR